MRRTLLPFFVTLVFAAALWLAVDLAAEVQTTVRIRLVVDFPDGQTSSRPLPRTVLATVHGAGWQVAQFALLGNPVMRVDLSQAAARESPTITHRMMMQAIALPAQVTIPDLDPDSIPVALEGVREQTVAVLPALHVRCRPGFEQAGPAIADPDSVRITGAESVVRTIDGWSTRPVAVTNATRPVRVDVPLSESLSDRVALSQHSVIVRADVQEIAERTFANVPIRVVNAPADIHVRVEPPDATVAVRGGVESLAAMRATDITASVDYLSLVEEHPGRAPVSVNAPGNTVVLHRSPASVAWYVRVR